MLKSEIQHQFWITKKTVQRKLRSKEDVHIISSDAELDAKIEVYKSISATSLELAKIIDQYKERLCILSQEESAFGRFLKEAGEKSKTTVETIKNTGKALSFCGQQRISVRVPLLRLQHDVDVFRYRAVADTHNTITSMEKERTEYRAALEWMKSASSELDPDTGRGVEKFRTAQSHVRNAKQIFDNLSLTSIQKIDLLAAARCNMFSHVLILYMSELKQFAQKTNATYIKIYKALEKKPKYDFCVLKELTQHDSNYTKVIDNNIPVFDKDQSFYIAEDFIDKKEVNSHENICKESSSINEFGGKAVGLWNNSEFEEIMDVCDPEKKAGVNNHMFDESSSAFLKLLTTKALISTKHSPQSSMLSPTSQLAAMKSKHTEKEILLPPSQVDSNKKSKETRSLQKYRWIEHFTDLDPLENFQAFDLKLSGNSTNIQQT